MKRSITLAAPNEMNASGKSAKNNRNNFSSDDREWECDEIDGETCNGGYKCRSILLFQQSVWPGMTSNVFPSTSIVRSLGSVECYNSRRKEIFACNHRYKRKI